MYAVGLNDVSTATQYSADECIHKHYRPQESGAITYPIAPIAASTSTATPRIDLGVPDKQ